jgi:serine/threonine protein kinase/tetratricopeptide (TPR) repeat protein
VSDQHPAASNPGRHNSGTNSDLEATLDSTAAPAGGPPSDLGSIGPYRLIRKLGEGGMGQVWLAEQSTPVKRQVALKIIKAGQYDDSALLRFNLERQTLAIMNHPAIAKVFDAGSSPAGQPYFVMEYVPGLPITNYCDTKRLPARERLALLAKVCDGVQHAHQKAIIHRDLKPTNILVVEVDGKPQPRIIDFGIAKAISRQSEDETLVTRAGGTVGTPGYVSPEQADPSISDVDTRTDVYSLGVVLYELLTGVLPFDVRHWKTKPLHEVLRELHEDDPPSPSTRISRDPVSKTAAVNRGIDPRQLASLLRGDLDWITLKAMEKDRARRYNTPSELSADIARYLRNEPVTARPVSAAYRARKYAQRHKFGVTAGGAMALLLIAFGVMQTIELRRITRERDRANRERDRASRVTDFMTGMFKVSDPSEARGNSVTARAILDKSSNEIKTGLAKDPEVQSELMFTMATTYANLGLYAQAHGLSAAALESRGQLLGAKDPKTLESMTQLGWIQDREGHDDDAEKLIRRTIDQARRVLGPEDPVTLDAMDKLAVILENQGHWDEEEKLLRHLIEIRGRRFGTEDPRTLRSEVNLADALSLEGHAAESEAMYRKTLEIEQRVFGPEHPQTLATMHNLANRIQEQGRYAEAEALYRQTLAIAQHVMGPEHPETVSTMSTLADTVYYAGRYQEAEKLHRESLEIELRTVGREHPYTTRTMEGLANVLAAEGRDAEAEKLERQVLEIRERILGPEHTDTLVSKYNLANILVGERHFPEAEKLIRETQVAQTRVLGPENGDTLASKAELANILNKEGRYQEAEKTARQALDIQARVLGPGHPDSLGTLQVLGIAMVHNRRYGEAKQLFEDVIEKIGKAQESNVSLAWYKFACVAAAAHDSDEAVQHLREAVKEGYKDIDRIQADDDLKSLRGYPRFEALLAEGRKPSHAVPQQHN